MQKTDGRSERNNNTAIARHAKPRSTKQISKPESDHEPVAEKPAKQSNTQSKEQNENQKEHRASVKFSLSKNSPLPYIFTRPKQ